jgi:hypothetical protein
MDQSQRKTKKTMTTLVQATIPMCTKCGAKCEYQTLGRVGNYYVCTECTHHASIPHWGYYEEEINLPDKSVAEHVAEIKLDTLLPGKK